MTSSSTDGRVVPDHSRRAGGVAIWTLVALIAGACTGSSSPSPAGTAVATPSPAAAPTATPTAGGTLSPAATSGALPSNGEWSELGVGGPAPAPREAHTWTVDATAQVAYLFGGRDGGTVLDDLWRFDLRAERWERVDPGGATPPARFGHNAVWLEGRGLVLFAGQSASGFFSDLWLYDPVAARWTELPSAGSVPVPRYGSCAVLAPDGRLWISHGFTEEQARFADTRAYDFVTGSWADETPSGGDVPVARCLHACFGASDGRFVLYAGQTTGVAALGDLWALTVGSDPDASRWAEIDEALPSARNLYAFARTGGAFVVFGGGSLERGYLDDTWAFSVSDLAAAPLATSGARPPARSAATLVEDRPAGRLLLFGGRDADRAFADVWSLALR